MNDPVNMNFETVKTLCELYLAKEYVFYLKIYCKKTDLMYLRTKYNCAMRLVSENDRNHHTLMLSLIMPV